MKTALSFLVLAAAVLTFSAFTLQKAPQYGGAQTCKACHSNARLGGESFKAWEKSPHANAFKTLQTAEADKIAKDKGFSTKAAETPECLSCHVSGMLAEKPVYQKTFKNTEGVGCESCHGPGSEYKNKHSKDVQEGVKLGLSLPKIADGSAEKQCRACHNEKSPTYKEFDFEKAWKEVAHPSGKS